MSGHALVHWFEASIPVFLVVWIAELDASTATLGFAVAAGYAAFGLGALPAGAVVDRFDPRRVVLACTLGMSAAFVVLGTSDGVAGVAIGVILWGAAASLYHPAGLSMISTGVRNRGRVFAWHGIAGNLGIAVGPFAAATLLVFLDWQHVALALSAPGFLAAAYGARLDFDATAAVDVDERGPRAGALASSRALFAGGFAVVFAVVAFEGLYYRGTLTYLPEILHGLPQVDVDLGLALEGFEAADYVYVGLLVVGVFGQYAGGRLTERVSVERGLTASFAGLALLALAFPYTAGLGLSALLLHVAALGFVLFAIQPFYQEAVAVYTAVESRGLAYGYAYLAEFGVGAASVAVGGVLLDHLPLAVFFAVLAAYAVSGAVLAAYLWSTSGSPAEPAR